MSIPIGVSQLDRYLSAGVSAHCFPANTAYSLPVLVRRGERIMEANFLYDNSYDADGTIPRPFAWLMLPTDGGQDFMFSWCSVNDFVSPEEFPEEQRVSTYLPGGELSINAYIGYRDEIRTLVDEMTMFAFKDELTEYQQEIVSRYRDLFLLLCYQGLYPFYEALAADLFEWIGLVLIAKSSHEALNLERTVDIIRLLEDQNRMFEEKIMTDGQKNLLFDELHEELQEYKNAVHLKVSRAMERDVIVVIDHLEKSFDRVSDEPPTPAGYEKLLKLFKDIHQDLEDILYRQGVDPYVVESDRVDLERQKVIATVGTVDPSLDKTVAMRVVKGWQREEEIVRPEYIKAYLYKQEK